MRYRKWWTLLAVCVATFMLLLDVTIVNVALPDIQRSLRASFSDLQWVVDAYSLTLAALLLTAGSLADLMGRKRVFILGLAVFTAASLLCALASTPTWLNLARGVQGVGGAMMFATSLALLAQEFTGRQRGTAFGIWGAVTGGAVAVGPLIGGALTEAQGWEWIFLVNVPVGLGAIALAQAKLAQPPEGLRGRVDWLGLVSFSGALFCLVLGLIRGNDQGWSSAEIVSLLIGSGLLLVIFVLVERRVRDPMLDLSLFRKPAFAGASIAAFALSAAMFSMFLFLTLYLQSILGYGPLDAGLRFLPNTLLAFAVAPLAGRCRRIFRSGPCSGAAWCSWAWGLCSCTGSTPARAGPRCCRDSSSPARARLPGTAYDAAQEVVLRVHELVGHLHRRVDDLLASGGSLSVEGHRLVHGVDELLHRLERGALATLDGLQQAFRQLPLGRPVPRPERLNDHEPQNFIHRHLRSLPTEPTGARRTHG